MIEQSTHCHHRYNNIEENLAYSEQDGIELSVRKGVTNKWLLYLHVDSPLVPMELRDSSALESRTQLYFHLVDEL
ncbi:hypothetical protein [Bacillus tuaregi]|uniref:hypothetical protein n=1 Tax=Bacillus tuaregi TaxID=1816695 RepID=UPI0008F91E41|nr:hypothetical protein [Bacillus tuaregi]